MDLGKNLSMSDWKVLFEIKLPASMGYIISGMKIGWARGWRAFISAEMVFGSIGGKGGIGWYIFNQRNFMDTPGIFAGILVVIIIGIIVENGIFGWLEKKCIHMGTKER
jgi:NitT/TauT family transport system permease protein